MLDKIERLEKPTQANDSMDIRLEPDVVSGNDVLTVTDLSKSFDTQTLFTNVDFEIKRGERVAIIGNNGTGKTTLLKIINGIIPADSGQIRLGSKVHIGYYDQEHQVLHMDKNPVPGDPGYLSKHEQHPDPQYTGCFPVYRR